MQVKRARWKRVARANSPAHLHLGEEAGNAAAAAARSAGCLAHDRRGIDSDMCACASDLAFEGEGRGGVWGTDVRAR